MRILILGGDGYLGWPQAKYFSLRGHDVFIFDNLARRRFDQLSGSDSILPLLSIEDRIARWKRETGKTIGYRLASTEDFPALSDVIRSFQPNAVVHFAEQKSAPYSMLDRDHAIETMRNNVGGTINVLYALKELAPDCHLVKLGTMGEYGTPNIDIEEGYLEIQHKGRTDRVLYPKNPGSFYHLSKVHDSDTIKKCCDWWKLRATDLNQGIVYGVEGNDLKTPELATRFDYDQIYGTVLNRFCVQAALRMPLTVYGTGGQTRSFIHLMDVLRCVELAVLNPASPGEFRVFNQFTETFSVAELAARVKIAAAGVGIPVSVETIENPRLEQENHYYRPNNSRLHQLGLRPTHLSDSIITSLIDLSVKFRNRIRPELILPTIRWKEASNQMFPKTAPGVHSENSHPSVHP